MTLYHLLSQQTRTTLRHFSSASPSTSSSSATLSRIISRASVRQQQQQQQQQKQQQQQQQYQKAIPNVTATSKTTSLLIKPRQRYGGRVAFLVSTLIAATVIRKHFRQRSELEAICARRDDIQLERDNALQNLDKFPHALISAASEVATTVRTEDALRQWIDQQYESIVPTVKSDSNTR